ncbi:MAG: YcaO-like family protein, partial [Actinomycetota bacterium]
ATVSAAMEAIELHCAEFSSIEPTAASHAELAADAAIIDVDDLALTRYSLFHPDRTERWVEGWDLIDQQPMWVPLHAARMGGVRMDTGWDAVSFQSGSNGLASGNVMLEAVLAALYEVVERDATTNWTLAERYTLARVPHIDLSTIDDPLPLDLIDRLASANVDLILRDCTIDTDLPTYQATIFDQHGELGLYSGMGTHLDPGIAMVRAITEAVQGRVVYVAGSRDDLFDHRRFMVNRDMGDHRHHTIDDALGGPTISAAVRRPGTAPTFEEDLSTTIDRVRAVGVEHIIVVDLTADDIGVPAVRVIVPGLEGYPFPNYQAGRRGRAFIAKMRELAAEETRAS